MHTSFPIDSEDVFFISTVREFEETIVALSNH